MDQSHFEKMAARIPKTRVAIDKSRWMRTFGTTSFMTIGLVGAFGFFIFGSDRIFNPIQYHPKRIVYKAYPDYVNGTISFYQKEVDNTLRYL